MDVFNRDTVLDVIENHLKSINARSFVSRVIFGGRHEFEPPDILLNIHAAIVQELNSGYCDVPVHGLLLLYKKYFFIISEGSEYTTMSHIGAILKHRDLSEKIQQTKLLAVYHNVKKRFFSSWINRFVEPCQLISPLSEELTESKILEILNECLKKLQHLSTIVDNKKIKFDSEDIKKSVPETAFIDAILSSAYILDLKTYSEMYLNLNEYSYTFENCWPTPFDFTPNLKAAKPPKEVFVQLLSDIDDFKNPEENT